MPPPIEDQIGAVARWYNLTQKYANITLPGLWNFPTGPDIPSDLLLPFGEFARRYGIEATTPFFTTISNVGVGGLEDVLTLYVLFAMGIPVTQEFLNNSLFVPANLSNSVLYDRAYNLLQDDVLLNSRVTTGNRSDSGVSLEVQSKNGTSKKLIKAKRMLFTPPPSVQNLQPFGLEANETTALSTFTGTWNFAAVARVPAIPAGYSVYFYAPDADSNNYLGIRDWPWTLTLTTAPNVPADEHLFEVLFATNYSISHDEAKSIIASAVHNLTTSGTFPANSTAGNSTIGFVAFKITTRYSGGSQQTSCGRALCRRYMHCKGSIRHGTPEDCGRRTILGMCGSSPILCCRSWLRICSRVRSVELHLAFHLGIVRWRK